MTLTPADMTHIASLIQAAVEASMQGRDQHMESRIQTLIANEVQSRTQGLLSDQLHAAIQHAVSAGVHVTIYPQVIDGTEAVLDGRNQR